MRNTLSLPVRQALRDNDFVWLRLENSSVNVASIVANFNDLDLFFACARGRIFGTFVNPMRTRRKDPLAGYIALMKDIENIASCSRMLASYLLDKRSVTSLMASQGF